MSNAHFGAARYRWITLGVMYLLLIPLAYVAAFALRFDGRIPQSYQGVVAATLPVIVLVRFVAFKLFRVDRGYWRHSGLADLISLAKAVTVSSAVLLALLFMTRHSGVMPRSVFVLDWLMAIFVIGGARFAVRSAWEGQLPIRNVRGKPTIVIGAGAGGERLLRQLQHDGSRAIQVAGFLDDDPSTHRMRLHGVAVLGGVDQLRAIVVQKRIELVVIAIPSATGEQMRRLVSVCADAGAEYRILPSLHEQLTGRAQPGELRKVELEDLLGRDPVSLDLELIKRDIAGRVVLVTGGAGSIGSELARQIARFEPARLVLLDQAESPLYMIQLELMRAFPAVEVVPVIGDITVAERVEAVFAMYSPEYVFHAAAYKHVPMMEANVGEAIRNNVIGTSILARCAAASGAGKFVLISTDKAVRPSSIMGATKRIAERIVLGLPRLRSSGTDFRAVRFGNVLGSDGSVVPLFRRQLAEGGPLTVTHPDVKRYFMTIPEAAQLVLQAAALPEAAGRISMLEMGAPICIVDLAEQLIRLSGLVPHRDVQIEFTGLRPGEKLDEELMAPTEAAVPTSVDKIRVVQTDEMDGELVERGIRRLTAMAALGVRDDMVREICSLVTECTDGFGECPDSRERGLRPGGIRPPEEVPIPMYREPNGAPGVHHGTLPGLSDAPPLGAVPGFGIETSDGTGNGAGTGMAHDR